MKPADRLLLSRVEASEYLGIGVSLFLSAVKAGQLPAPKTIGRRTLWARPELDATFLSLPAKLKPVQNEESDFDFA